MVLLQIIDRHNEPLSLSSIDFVLNINLRGTLDFVRQALPYMTQVQPDGADGERGVVILVSSSAAYDGQPGQVCQCAPHWPLEYANRERFHMRRVKVR